jgi:hypothetical protein
MISQEAVPVITPKGGGAAAGTATWLQMLDRSRQSLQMIELDEDNSFDPVEEELIWQNLTTARSTFTDSSSRR